MVTGGMGRSAKRRVGSSSGRNRGKQGAGGILLVVDEEHIGVDPAVEVGAERDLADDPAFLANAEGPMVAVVADIEEAQAGYGADAGSRARQGPDHGAVPEADRPGEIDGPEQMLDLGRGDERRLAFAPVVPARTLDRVEGIEKDRVTGDEEGEEPPQGGERDPLGRGTLAHGLDPRGRVTRGDGGERLLALAAPVEEADGVTAVRPTCVPVPEPREEELLGGQHGATPRLLDEGVGVRGKLGEVGPRSGHGR